MHLYRHMEFGYIFNAFNSGSVLRILKLLVDINLVHVLLRRSEILILILF